MAVKPNVNYTSGTLSYKKLNVEVHQAHPRDIGPGSGTIAKLHPLAYNTSTDKWVRWTGGGANGAGTIVGFLWQDGVTLDATNDRRVTVMLAGKLDYRDVLEVVLASSSGTEAQLKAELQGAAFKSLGFDVQHLAGMKA